MKNSKIAIDGVEVTSEYLLDRAKELTEIYEQVELIKDFLDSTVCRAKQGDDFGALFFFKSNVGSNLVDNLHTISEKIVKISDGLCTDERDN